MSVASISSSTYTNNAYAPKKIEVDFKALEKKYHIAPDVRGNIDMMLSMTLREALKNEGMVADYASATDSAYENTGNVRYWSKQTLSFQTAVETVVKAINGSVASGAYEKEGFFHFDISGNDLQSQLIIAIGTIENVHSKIPKPPQHENESSANDSHTRWWLGSILSMLHDQGCIRTFGYTAATGFWGKLYS